MKTPTKFIADANVALRILRGPEDLFSPAAQEMALHAEWIVDQVDDGNMILHFPDSVIPEIVYVLHKSYKEPREQVSELILTLIEADGVEATTAMKEAVKKFATINLDIVDLHLAELNRENRLPVLSWDKGYKKLDCEHYSPKEIYDVENHDGDD